MLFNNIQSATVCKLVGANRESFKKYLNDE